MALNICQAYVAHLSAPSQFISFSASCDKGVSLVNLYKDGLKLFRAGFLREARNTVEEVLERCALEGVPRASFSPSSTEESFSTTVNSFSTSYTFSAPYVKVPLSTHLLFTDALLLLANIYSADGIFSEAEHLLVTSVGYVRDSFNPGQYVDLSSTLKKSANQQQIHQETSSDMNKKEEKVLAQLQNIAFATISYNRALLCVEEYQYCCKKVLNADQEKKPFDSSTRNDSSLARGTSEKETDQVWLPNHTKKGISFLSWNISQLPPHLFEKVQKARDVLLDDVICRLQDCLDDGRQLLADALHTRGVCQLLLGDHVHALLDFQKSIDIRCLFLSRKTSAQSFGNMQVAHHFMNKIPNEGVSQFGNYNLARDHCCKGEGKGSMLFNVTEDSTDTLMASSNLKLALSLEHIVQLYHLLDRPSSAFLFSSHSSSSALTVRLNWLQGVLHWITCTRRQFLDMVSRASNETHRTMHPLVLRALFYEGVFAVEHGRVHIAKQCFEECLDFFSCGKDMETRKAELGFQNVNKEEMALQNVRMYHADKETGGGEGLNDNKDKRIIEGVELPGIPIVGQCCDVGIIPFPTLHEVLKWLAYAT